MIALHDSHDNMPPAGAVPTAVGAAGAGAAGAGGMSNLVFSAIMRWNPMPTPSMTASRTAQPMALFRAWRSPPRTASEPPVKKPAITVEGSAERPVGVLPSDSE